MTEPVPGPPAAPRTPRRRAGTRRTPGQPDVPLLPVRRPARVRARARRRCAARTAGTCRTCRRRPRSSRSTPSTPGRRCRRSPGAPAGAYRLPATAAARRPTATTCPTACPFCGAPIVAETAGGDQIAPEAVVPFGIDPRAAQDAVRGWVRSRWFAPNKLKKVGATEQLHGTYLPHWTYDAGTATDYSGMRGEHYWETETYSENGETKTREVMRTAWYPARRARRARLRRRPRARLDTADARARPAARAVAAGAGGLLPARLPVGVPDAALRRRARPGAGRRQAADGEVIEGDCRDDIGGDEQRVNSMDVRYARSCSSSCCCRSGSPPTSTPAGPTRSS